MQIEVDYAASSNISYRGTWHFEVDNTDWEELDEEQRQALVDEMVSERVFEDLGIGDYRVTS